MRARGCVKGRKRRWGRNEKVEEREGKRRRWRDMERGREGGSLFFLPLSYPSFSLSLSLSLSLFY